MEKFVLAAAVCLALAGCIKDRDGDAATEAQLDSQKPKKEAIVESKKPEVPQKPKKWDGPLGVMMGISVKDLSDAGIAIAPIDNSPLIYRAGSAPAPSGSFDDYVYLISENVGLCRVTAWTPEKEANSFGEQIIATFDELQSALTEKYGKPEVYKFVQRGSIWNERRDFMMGLAKEERTHVAAWTSGATNSLPQDIESISLHAVAFSSSKGAVKLTYEFKNLKSCFKEAKQKKHANL